METLVKVGFAVAACLVIAGNLSRLRLLVGAGETVHAIGVLCELALEVIDLL